MSASAARNVIAALRSAAVWPRATFGLVWRLTLIALVAMAVILGADISRAAPTFTVNSAADVPASAPLDNGVCETAPGNGVCTLRAAVMKANHYSGGGVTIMLPALPPGGAYTLSIPASGNDDETTGDLELTAPMSLIGAGQTSTIINGNGVVTHDRIFWVQSVDSISNVTIRGGTAVFGINGGAIYDTGNLTLTDTVITGNTATSYGGGILMDSNSPLSLVDTVVSGNTANLSGGGIYIYSQDQGHVTLVNSVVTGNVATSGIGGGIYDGSFYLSITGTTVSNNTAGGSGGGIFDDELTMVNSTVSGNSAKADGGGIYGSASLYNVTVTGNYADSDRDGQGNGGGANGDFSLQNSILGGNFETHPQCHGTFCGIAVIPGDCSGTITSVSHNILTYANTSYCTVSGSVMAVDPKLGPLQDNGGPTQTNALLTGSPAIDGGDPAGCTDPLGATLSIDQRGYSRPAGNACDIGAYEYGGVAPATPTPTPSPVSTPTPTATASPASSTTPTPTPSASATPTAHASPTPTHTPSSSRIEGDANCDGHVTEEDAIVILKESEGLVASCAQTQALHLANDDTNCDGAVTPIDALEVLRHLAGLPELSLPTGCPQVGAALP